MSNRQFGSIFAIFFAGLALYPMIAGGSPRLTLIMIACGFGVAAALAPKLLEFPNRLWKRLGLILQQVVSALVVGMIFFLLVTPIGWILRLLGKTPLQTRLDPAAPSYWVEAEGQDFDPIRQF